MFEVKITDEEREKCRKVADAFQELYELYGDMYVVDVGPFGYANEALRCENLGLRAKMESIEAIPILYLGSEDEFYPGEIKNIVLEILGDAIKNIKSNSRRADVVSDVYRNNDYKNLSGERQQKVKNLLKSYDGMSKELRQDLKNLGFEITEDGKHYKLTYCGDRRYWTTLSKTPSDYREGINAAKTICRDML